MNEIELIQVEQLMHHPDNPRKDLGDLEELSASIKANGILQNLTVVRPDKWKAEDGDYYWVLIGNRRMEAAIRAGLQELPCQIVHMSHTEQIATMLQENMQRSDLTVYEQAQGIQTMMDLGFDKDQISERTGFSRSTIDRRLAVASLPAQAAKQAVDDGYDLLDLVEISKIESKKTQEDLLKGAVEQDGTINRNWLRSRITSAQREENREREKKRLLPEIEKFAEALPENANRWGNEWEHINSLDVELEPGSVVKAPEEPGKYFYHAGWSQIEIYRKVKKEKHVKTDVEIALEKKQHDAKELNARMKENRIAFVSSFTPSTMQESKLKSNLWKYIFGNASRYENGNFRCSYHSWGDAMFRKFCGMPKEEDRDQNETIMDEMKRRRIPLGRAILAWILCGGVKADDREGYANTYNGDHKKDEDLDEVYQILEDAGYVMTEEERQWKDGTHPFYTGEKE